MVSWQTNLVLIIGDIILQDIIEQMSKYCEIICNFWHSIYFIFYNSIIFEFMYQFMLKAVYLFKLCILWCAAEFCEQRSINKFRYFIKLYIYFTFSIMSVLILEWKINQQVSNTKAYTYCPVIMFPKGMITYF